MLAFLLFCTLVNVLDHVGSDVANAKGLGRPGRRFGEDPNATIGAEEARRWRISCYYDWHHAIL